jgi:hypothetical protein
LKGEAPSVSIPDVRFLHKEKYFQNNIKRPKETACLGEGRDKEAHLGSMCFASCYA